MFPPPSFCYCFFSYWFWAVWLWCGLLYSFLHVSCAWGSLDFMGLSISSFHQIWKIIWHHSIFFFCFFSLGDPNDIYFRVLEVFFQFTDALFIFKNVFNVYLFLRETECKWGRAERERGRQRIWSRLQAQSCQYRARFGAWTHQLWDHDLSQLGTQLTEPARRPVHVLLLFPFHARGNRGPERLRNLLKVILLKSGRATIWSRHSGSQSRRRCRELRCLGKGEMRVE